MDFRILIKNEEIHTGKKDSIFDIWNWSNWMAACGRIYLDPHLSPCKYTHPINSQQTPKLLRMTRSVYQKEHVMVVSRGALPRALQIQRQMLETNYWTGHEVPERGPGGRTRRAGGAYSPMGRTMISATQMPKTPRD